MSTDKIDQPGSKPGPTISEPELPPAAIPSQKTSRLALLLIALLLTGAITTLVSYQSQHKDLGGIEIVTAQRSLIIAKDSTETFQFTHPDNWVNEKYTWESCCEGPEKQEPDWSVQSKPITLVLNGNENVKITKYRQPYDTYSYASFADIVSAVKQDYFAKVEFEGTLDTGQKALYSRVDYLGPPDAKVESFTDYRRHYDLGDTYLFVEFREKYSHDWYADQTLDNSAYTTDYEAIVNSLTFLK